LAAFLTGIAFVAWQSNLHTFKLDVLPWTGDELVHYTLIAGIVGLLVVILAVTGIFRYTFPLWALIVFVMMFRGFLLRPYSFSGKEEFYAVLWLIAGAFGAFLSSLTIFKLRKRR
jgi:hypothetical protein